MKVKDLLNMEISVDVYDDVCDALAIAFDGPQTLTEEGTKKFADVLEYGITFTNGGYCAVVSVDDPDEKTWKRRLRKAKEFFEAAAGYCSADDWDKWFLPE